MTTLRNDIIISSEILAILKSEDVTSDHIALLQTLMSSVLDYLDQIENEKSKCDVKIKDIDGLKEKFATAIKNIQGISDINVDKTIEEITNNK